MFWVAVSSLAYQYLLYPALMVVSAWITRRIPSEEYEGRVSLPFVSLCIPAHNEETILEAKLSNALSIDYPRERLEIIVASDGSIDRTVEIARRYVDRGIRVLAFPERRGKAVVLNDACCEAQGELLCLGDANVMFAPDALVRLVARLDDPSVGAVSGDVQIASHESNFGAGEILYYRLERAVQRGESCLGSMMGVDGGMYVIRRGLFSALPPDTILDDFVISMRVIRKGFRVVYEPGAVARENATATARQEWRRRVRVAAGAVQSLKRREWPPLHRPVEVWQYVSHKALRWMTPLFLAVSLMSNVPLYGEHWLYRLTLVGQCGMYGLAALALLLVRVRETRLGGIPFYIVLSNVAMGYGLIKGLFNLQPVTWVQADRAPTVRKSS